MRDFSVKLIATFLGVGYLPLVPGTFGSLAGLIIFFSVKHSSLLQLAVAGSLMVLGFWASSQAEIIFKQKDHRRIVIDEVSGMLISLLFVPFSFKSVLIGLFLFRLLDTLKPYPAGKIEHLGGGLGVMGDDIIAGLYTNLILQFVSRIFLKL